MEKFHPSPKRAWLYSFSGAFLLLLAVQIAVQLSPIKFDTLLASAAAMLVAIIYAVASTAQARFTSYSIEDGSLVMRRDFFSTDSKIIPIKNIDNLQVKASFIARLLGVCNVYIDTPGGIGVELTMNDVPSARADELMDEVEMTKAGKN